jgi:hypothetical protein
MKLDFLKRKGYDAVVDVKGKYKQIMIVDPTSVQTESQKVMTTYTTRPSVTTTYSTRV